MEQYEKNRHIYGKSNDILEDVRSKKIKNIVGVGTVGRRINI